MKFQMAAHNRDTRPLLRGVLLEPPGWCQAWHPVTWLGEPIPDLLVCTCVTLAVWCPWCRTHHYHGWDPADDGRVATHRAPHCGGQGPFAESGYYVSTFRRSDEEYGGHIVRPGRALVWVVDARVVNRLIERRRLGEPIRAGDKILRAQSAERARLRAEAEADDGQPH